MAKKLTAARIDGTSNGRGNHAHGLLFEVLPDDSALLDVQVTVTGGADGKKRHASALVPFEELAAAVDAVRAARAARGTL